MDAIHQLAPTVGIEPACDALGVARASFYRQPVFGPALPVPMILRPAPARALSSEERHTVRAVLHSERFQDCSRMKANIFAPLGPCIECSNRTAQRASAAIS